MPKHVSYDMMLAICAEQSVTFYQSVLDPTADTYAETHCPTDMVRASAFAAELVANSPSESFSSKPLEETPDIADDPAAVSLAWMSNDVTNPYSGPGGFRVDRVSKYGIDSCSKAEPNIAKTMLYLDNPADSIEELGAQIVLDEAGEPIFLRKRKGEPSALTLGKTIIDGVRYPAGSIVRLNLIGDQYDPGSDFNVPIAPYARTTVFAANAVRSARFSRLSSFAYNPGQRAPFRYDTRNASPLGLRAAEYVQTEPLETLRETVRRVAKTRPVEDVLE